MGLDRDALTFIAAARSSGVSFRATATLGRQTLVVSGRQLHEVYADAGVSPPRPGRVFRGWVDGVLYDLGADEVTSIDASDYEGATFLHDLNHPVPDDLIARFSTVLDAGTLEHIFNVPVAIQNCMRMVEPNGHLLLISPTNNEAGHGFYQFSPELFYRILAPAYGFEIEQMLLKEPARYRSRWYEVRDPRDVGARGQYRTRSVAYLYVRARRVGRVPAFDPAPQQSDYALRWSEPRRAPRATGLRASVSRVVTAKAPQVKRLYLASRPGTARWYKRPPYRSLPRHFRPVPGPGWTRSGSSAL